MKINSVVSTVLAVILIGVRVRNIRRVSRDLPCRTSTDDIPKNAFGQCKDNIQTYYDKDAKPTGTTRECGTFVADMLSAISCCVLTGTYKDTNKMVVQFWFLIINLMLIYFPLHETLKRLILVVGSVVSMNGPVFEETLLVAGAITWSIAGDILLRAGTRLLDVEVRAKTRARARDGRFIRCVDE